MANPFSARAQRCNTYLNPIDYGLRAEKGFILCLTSLGTAKIHNRTDTAKRKAKKKPPSGYVKAGGG